ncbi:MAG: DUF3501 family protein [Thiotrichales bacterium]
MQKLTREDLMSLEQYAVTRPEFRRTVMAHKKPRNIAVGPSVTLHFEDRLIVQYQVQEMLRVERIFEAAGIQEELEAYNPLIPDGTNFKATMMVEFPDPEERKVELSRLIGIEDVTYVQIGAHARSYAIADEDLERENDTKTSSVHFLRFELSPEMINSARDGETILVGIDHANYRHEVELGAESRGSLIKDLVN